MSASTAVPATDRDGLGRQLRDALGPSGMAAAVGFAVVLIVALTAPLIAPHPADQADILSVFAPPSAEHLLGTDSSGRDILSRLLVGSQTTLVGALAVAVLAGAAGTLLGLLSGWFGGWTDTVVSRFLDLLFAFPGILLAFVIVTVFPRSLLTAAVAVAISTSPFLARIVRGEVRRLRQTAFVQALVITGVGTARLWLRHVLPGIAPLVIAQLTVVFGYSMVGLATLSFLGLGTQPPTADWGRMISDGKPYIQAGHPQESLYASAAIALTVICVTVLGDRLSARVSREDR